MDDWQALDWVLTNINSLDVSECKTPEEAKKLIYRELMKMRPRKKDEVHST